MIVKLEMRMSGGEVPEELRTGDKVRVEAVGVVTRIEDDVIDVTPIAGPRQEVPGERTVSVLLEMAVVDPITADA